MTPRDIPIGPHHVLRVAILATSERVRTSLRHLLTCEGGSVVVESPPVSASHPDVIVLDLDPAEADSHVEQIRCLPADVPAVVVGDDGGVAELARAAGAWFVDKADAADLLLRSVLLAGRRDDLTAR